MVDRRRSRLNFSGTHSPFIIEPQNQNGHVRQLNLPIFPVRGMRAPESRRTCSKSASKGWAQGPSFLPELWVLSSCPQSFADPFAKSHAVKQGHKGKTCHFYQAIIHEILNLWTVVLLWTGPIFKVCGSHKVLKPFQWPLYTALLAVLISFFYVNGGSYSFSRHRGWWEHGEGTTSLQTHN